MAATTLVSAGANYTKIHMRSTRARHGLKAIAAGIALTCAVAGCGDSGGSDSEAKSEGIIQAGEPIVIGFVNQEN